MKSVRILFLIFLFVFFGFGSIGKPINAAAKEENQCEGQNVCFYWAFGALVKSGGELTFTRIKRDAVLKTGDQIKMYLELRKKCFLYVIHQDSKDEITLLFPRNFNQFSTYYDVGVSYYIPQDNLWFQLDEDKGRETLYLLASAKRLITIERLIQNYSAITELREKEDLKQNILAEIRKIKIRHRDLKALPERPVQIVGTIRGDEPVKKSLKPDVASIAVQISAKNFYYRTFTIDHK